MFLGFDFLGKNVLKNHYSYLLDNITFTNGYTTSSVNLPFSFDRNHTFLYFDCHGYYCIYNLNTSDMSFGINVSNMLEYYGRSGGIGSSVNQYLNFYEFNSQVKIQTDIISISCSNSKFTVDIPLQYPVSIDRSFSYISWFGSLLYDTSTTVLAYGIEGKIIDPETLRLYVYGTAAGVSHPIYWQVISW